MFYELRREIVVRFVDIVGIGRHPGSNLEGTTQNSLYSSYNSPVLLQYNTRQVDTHWAGLYVENCKPQQLDGFCDGDFFPSNLFTQIRTISIIVNSKHGKFIFLWSMHTE